MTFFVAAAEQREAAFDDEVVVKSGRAVHQDDRMRRFYDDFVAERNLALLGSCYMDRGTTRTIRF
jgi:hypothetical protein